MRCSGGALAPIDPYKLLNAPKILTFSVKVTLSLVPAINDTPKYYFTSQHAFRDIPSLLISTQCSL